MRRAWRVAAAGAVLFLAGCGSTVQGVGQQANGTTGDGLAAPGATSTSGAGGAAGVSTIGGGAGGLVPGTTGGMAGQSTSSGAGATGGSSATGVGSAPGARNTGPIELGFIVTNVSNAGDFGVSSGQSFSDQQLYDALVAAMNKRGGINGRQIKPVYGVTDTASADWNSDFQAACAKFTQDHHVAAVVGYIFVFLDSFETCLAKAGVPHFYGGYQPGDVGLQRKYASLVGTSNPTTDVHYQVGLSGAIASGLLTPKSKLGVVVDTCGGDDTAFNRVGIPYLKAHHINFEVFTGECSTGARDDGKAVSEVQSAELKFRADGIDTVFVEGVAALLFAENAESQHWTPTYLMTFGGAAFEGNVPNDQLANFHGFGWMPAVDVDPQHQPYAWNPAQKRCLDRLASQGLQPKGYNDFMEAFTTCDGLFLYANALAADGGQTAAAPVVSAAASVTSKTPLAATYGGAGRYVANQHGGPAMWRQWGWNTSCSCFQYTGSAHPMP